MPVPLNVPKFELKDPFAEPRDTLLVALDNAARIAVMDFIKAKDIDYDSAEARDLTALGKDMVYNCTFELDQYYIMPGPVDTEIYPNLGGELAETFERMFIQINT